MLGDRGQYGHDLMGVFLEGTQVDSVSTAPGQVVTRSFEVEVRDSHLTAQFRDFGGRDANVVVEALRVSATTPPGPTLFISDVQGTRATRTQHRFNSPSLCLQSAGSPRK